MTMTFKILSGLFLGFGHFGRDIGLVGVGVRHGVTFDLGSAKVCSPAIYETSFSYEETAETDYCMHFFIIVLFPLTAILQLINFTAS